MNARLPKLLNLGLAMLMAGLFIAVFILNRSQYRNDFGYMDISLESSLKHFAKGYSQDIERQENDLFGLAEGKDILQADLFLVDEQRVLPACTASPLTHVQKKTAELAFEKGINSLPNKSALPLFKTAALIPVETSDDLYRKISAHFNMLELQYDVRTVCSILTLLNLNEIQLNRAQSDFFRSMLEEQVPNLDQIEARLLTLNTLAAQIDKKLNRQKGAYREAIEGQILSVRHDRLALLYTPQLEGIDPFIITTEPKRLYRELVPGHFLTVPEQFEVERRHRLRRDYYFDNAVLGIMALLGGALVYAMFVATDRQRKLDATRTEFISTVSHELRTPLSLIRLHAETLKHGRISESKVGEYHQTILTEAERLTGIVNNVLDFSRMERNKLQIHPEKVDLSELTERATGAFNDRLAQEGFILESDIPPNITCTADPLAYSQIVFNLLDNAIKYSDGAKTIRIGLDERDGWTILTVADQGIGIPDKLKKHIFEEFVRSEDSKVTARRGSGIGLSVAKRLVEKMNGTIVVADNEPKGSVFTVRLGECNEATGC